MNKTLLLLLLTNLCTWIPLQGQVSMTNPQHKEAYLEIPQERIFLHYNTSLLFAGEYLYYKTYCIDAHSKQLSGLSSTAYVELVAEDGTSVFQHKLTLREGVAQGDFFIQPTVPSGNYKLLGYTQWMKNGEKLHFFRGDLLIINPYRGDQKTLLPANQEGKTAIAQQDRERNDPSFSRSSQRSQNLNLRTNAETFTSREQVNLQITDAGGNLPDGNFSVSVRKIDSLPTPFQFSSTNFYSLYEGIREFSDADREKIFLPELRGNLLSGEIKPKEGSGDLSGKTKHIAVSIPGEDFIYQVASSDNEGKFRFYLKEPYSGNDVFLQIIGEDREKYEISLDKSPTVETASLSFNSFRLTPAMEKLILQRSVHNQVENAYYSIKPDTITIPDLREPFYGTQSDFYDLDEYTRFRTMRETFIEIINSSWVTKDKEGNPLLEVRALENATNYYLPPLVLLDGIMLQDHSPLVEFPATKIKSIEILRENFYLGPHVFQGIISAKTIDADFMEAPLPAYIKKMPLDKPQPKKNYFRQTYTDSTRSRTDRIPDYRYQLLWEPKLELKEEKGQVIFFTSDVTGEYEIRVEGFGPEGEPFSGRKTIRVE